MSLLLFIYLFIFNYVDEIVDLKKKLQVLEASNRILVSEKDETDAVDVSAIKELKKAVREAKKKEKDDAATIVRLQATIDSFKVPNVEDAGAVSKRGIKKEKDALPQKIAAVKGKKGKGKVIEESGSADDSASSHESQAPVTKRKRSSRKILAKEAELSPADESSVEGFTSFCFCKLHFTIIIFLKYIFHILFVYPVQVNEKSRSRTVKTMPPGSTMAAPTIPRRHMQPPAYEEDLNLLYDNGQAGYDDNYSYVHHSG